MKCVRSHCHKFLHTGLKKHTDLRDRLSGASSIEEVKKVIEEMGERRKEMSAEEKLGWYHRYWDSMGLGK